MTTTKGTLFLTPNLLGITPPEDVLPARTIAVAARLRCFVVETAKPARAFLKTLPLTHPLQSLDIRELPPADKLTSADCESLLAPATSGEDIGLLSDAGCPAVADPGAKLVAAAHRMGIRVVPLVGPSSILLALMASGLDGQHFAFHGYLPVKPPERNDALKRLDEQSGRLQQTQLFIETPYRNMAMLQAITVACGSATRVSIAAGLTTPEEWIETHTVREWKPRMANIEERLNKRPALFSLLAPR